MYTRKPWRHRHDPSSTPSRYPKQTYRSLLVGIDSSNGVMFAFGTPSTRSTSRRFSVSKIQLLSWVEEFFIVLNIGMLQFCKTLGSWIELLRLWTKNYTYYKYSFHKRCESSTLSRPAFVCLFRCTDSNFRAIDLTFGRINSLDN